MIIDYQKLLDFIVESGKRLNTRAGNIADIGITKSDLTEEDIAIERGLKKIIEAFDGKHVVFAEEENDFYQEAENIWVVDPISGTSNFIKGLPHYGVVISHLVNQKAVFAAVYDPFADELFTAYLGKGAFLNGQKIQVSKTTSMLIVRISSEWAKPELVERVVSKLSGYEIENRRSSMAVNHCWVASGRYDGFVSFTKDAFPEFAGGLILREAGGQFTNIEGKSDILPTDRIFVGGNNKTYSKIFQIIKEEVN